MSNANSPASPMLGSPRDYSNEGLTKREHFASMAMQAIVSVTPHESIKHLGSLGDAIAESALRIADDLLAELEKQNDQS